MIYLFGIAAVVLAIVAIKEHVTAANIKADVAKVHSVLTALIAKGVTATKADVSVAIADLKKWV